MTRCIHCTRCIRFLREIAGNYSLGMLGRGQLSEIGLYTKNVLISELSANIIDFCPVGALTNKNFALNYRSWDSYYIDSIDIMDPFLSSVRIYHDNLKIRRILSNYNNVFDAYWISDKSRFFFDSLKIQRLTFPLILKKNSLFDNNNKYNLFYVAISWKNISNCLKDYINNNSKKLLIKSFLGDFIDLETISELKYLTLKSGSNLFINKTEFNNFEINNNNLNFDKESNYINTSKYALNEYDFYIFYNYNLRIENPIFNSKLRQKVIWFNFSNLYFFGTNYNLTYKYYHLSNSNIEFINFLSGKHWVCNILLKYNKICFIYGNTVFQDFFIKKSWLYYYNKLQIFKNNLFKFKKKEFNIIYLTSSISSISSFDLVFINKINLNEYSENKNFINYYIGLNQLNIKITDLIKNNLFKNCFNIYQNSFFDQNFNFCNLMLPVYNCFEIENQFFINSMGLIKQNTKLEQNFEEFIKTNSDSLKFLFKVINFNYKSELIFKLDDFLPIEFFKKIRKFFIFNNKKLYFINFGLIKYKNFYLISLNKNFYKSNIYCFYSKQLNMMSNLFFKDKSNFNL